MSAQKCLTGQINKQGHCLSGMAFFFLNCFGGFIKIIHRGMMASWKVGPGREATVPRKAKRLRLI